MTCAFTSWWLQAAVQGSRNQRPSGYELDEVVRVERRQSAIAVVCSEGRPTNRASGPLARRVLLGWFDTGLTTAYEIAESPRRLAIRCASLVSTARCIALTTACSVSGVQKICSSSRALVIEV